MPQASACLRVRAGRHSLMDGLAIGAGFQAGGTVGAVVAIAVLSHDFADGFNTYTITSLYGNDRRRALTLLTADALAPVMGAAITLLLTIPRRILGLTRVPRRHPPTWQPDILPEAHAHHQAASPWPARSSASASCGWSSASPAGSTSSSSRWRGPVRYQSGGRQGAGVARGCGDPERGCQRPHRGRRGRREPAGGRGQRGGRGADRVGGAAGRDHPFDRRHRQRGAVVCRGAPRRPSRRRPPPWATDRPATSGRCWRRWASSSSAGCWRSSMASRACVIPSHSPTWAWAWPCWWSRPG